MQRRILLIAAAVLTIGLAAAFYYAFLSPKDEPVRETQDVVAKTSELPEFQHPLTGVPLNEPQDVLVASVMFDNFDEVKARPGLEYASIVYEALAEGGITRVMGVFDTLEQVPKIGPVRSLRPYFLDWALEYDGILMHVGGSPDALRLVRQYEDTILDVDQIGADEQYFFRDESLDAPHNVFTTYNSWLQLIERFKLESTVLAPWKYSLLPLEPTDIEAQQVEVKYFPGNVVGWVYNDEPNNYVRFVNGERQVYITGDQVNAVNVVLIEVPSETIDSIGRQDMETIGSGAAVVLTNGKKIEATWFKDSRLGRMRFINEAQEEVTFNQGTTWVQVVPSFDDMIVVQ